MQLYWLLNNVVRIRYFFLTLNYDYLSLLNRNIMSKLTKKRKRVSTPQEPTKQKKTKNISWNLVPTIYYFQEDGSWVSSTRRPKPLSLKIFFAQSIQISPSYKLIKSAGIIDKAREGVLTDEFIIQKIEKSRVNPSVTPIRGVHYLVNMLRDKLTYMVLKGKRGTSINDRFFRAEERILETLISRFATFLLDNVQKRQTLVF